MPRSPPRRRLTEARPVPPPAVTWEDEGPFPVRPGTLPGQPHLAFTRESLGKWNLQGEACSFPHCFFKKKKIRFY